MGYCGQVMYWFIKLSGVSKSMFLQHPFITLVHIFQLSNHVLLPCCFIFCVLVFSAV